MKKFDIIAIGDTTSDIFLELPEAKVKCEKNKEDCLLCLAYGDKIAIDKTKQSAAAGNAANVAVGTTKLELKVALYTKLGSDFIGKEAFQKLKSEGVYTDYIQFDEKRDTNFSTILSYRGERTILSFHQPRVYLLPKLAESDFIYLTSLGSHHKRLHKQIISHIAKTNSKLAFNPGTRQLNDGLLELEPLLKKTFILFVNKKEAEKLLGASKDIKTLLKLLKNQGPKIVVITDGDNGSYSFDGNNFYFQHKLKVITVEKTGAGDSYSSGFLAAIFLGYSIPTAMRWGSINAAFVVQKVGAQEGLLNRGELIKLLGKNPQLKPRKI